MINPERLSDLRADVRSLLRPYGRVALSQAKAYGNDALAALGRPPRFHENVDHQWRRILDRSRDLIAKLPEARAPRVLFAAVYGQIGARQVLESTFSMALRLRGISSTVLACDQVLPACDWHPFGNNDPSPGEFGPHFTERTRLETCRICMEDLKASHGLPGIEQVSFSQVQEPGDLERARALVASIPYENYQRFVHRGVSVGEYAFSSVMRTTLRGTLDDNPRTRFLFERFLLTAILVVEFGNRILDRVQPDRLVVHDGVYVTQGTMVGVARARGIPVVVVGTPYRKGTIWLSHNDTYHRTLITDPNDRWERLEWTPDRARIADEYLHSKHLLPRDYLSYHVAAEQDERAIREEVGLTDAPIVSLYTNVLWDSQLYYRHNAFPTMLAWLFDTIAYFEKRPDLQLAIRIHPAESRSDVPTNQPLLPEIRRAFPTLPANVKLIPPESRISSYALARMSVASLIYGARIGVELALLGTPVIVAGQTYVRGKGFTYDAETQDQYFALLGRMQTLPRNGDEQILRAKKWYYHYFFRLMMPFSLFSVDEVVGMSKPRLAFESLEELLPGRSPVLDVVCQGIIDASSPFEYDDPHLGA